MRNMMDERVDVEVMLKQMRRLNNDDVEMDLHTNKKIKRQLKRIKKEKSSAPF